MKSNNKLKLALSVSGPCELPFFEYSYQTLFTTLGVDNVILLYTSVLLENQVLLFSAGKWFFIY